MPKEKIIKKRLDILLLEKGLVSSRTKADGLIMAGAVFVNGNRVDKKGELIPESAHIEVRGQVRYVSRGGDKLEGAIKDFGVDVTGFVAMDIGSSTGGFTDFLLQHGAIKVFAIDVGTHQLDDRLRGDPRIILFENCHIKDFAFEKMAEKVDVIVIDVSFISLTKIIPLLKIFLKESGSVVALIKPQFELSYEEVSKTKGVIKDESLIQKAIEKIKIAATDHGFAVKALTPSPIKGAKGNQEWFIHFGF